ncbi:porin [Duganella flavida]|nr:porin [Duganella flavida]
MYRSAIHAAAALALVAAHVHASAEPAPPLDRASLSLGAFSTEPRIDYQGDTNYGRIATGSYLREHVSLPRLKAQLLLGDTQGLDFDYYRYDKTYNPALSGSTNINGLPLTGNGKLNAKLKLDLAKLAYKWWIGSDNNVVGVGVGAAYYRARLDGTASGVLNGVAGNAAYNESEHAYAPLLELGWRHAVSDTVRVYADASGIKKNGGTIRGHIYSGALGVEWYPTPAVGVVAEYSASKTSLNRNRDNTDLNMRLNGPAAYVKFRF